MTLPSLALLFASVLSEPLVFMQWQFYPVREQVRGYLRRYPDQPLIVDSTLSPDADAARIAPHPVWADYHSMADVDFSYAEGRSYGVDGFAFFPARYRAANWRARLTKVPGVYTQAIVNFWRDSGTESDIDEIEKAVRYGCGAKIGGKTLILSYWTDRFNTPAQLAAKLKRARERVGDTFVYMAATSWSSGVWDWRATGRVAPERMEKMKHHFREMLRVADGIILDGTMSNSAVTNHTRNFAGGYHRIMTTTAREVVDEPEFKDRKLLGFTLSLGHQNAYHQNYTANAIGTETLRQSFEAAIAGRPDVILIPEWDEYNESTCWMPTLYNGYSTKRLFRYYNAVLRNRPQTVMPGDDVSVPNLVLSYRKAVSPGEWLYFEALNVPDSSRTGVVTVALEFLGPEGRVFRALPARKLREDAIDVTRWDVPSEELAELTRAIDVRFVVNGKAYTGFHPIDIAPANSWNVKDVKQPLRDLAPVTASSFELSDDGLIRASVECGEPIRHLMLTGNGCIQYIHNPSSAVSGFREDASNAVFSIAASRFRQVASTNFSYAVSGAPEAVWMEGSRVVKGERFQTDRIFKHGETVFLRIPRSRLGNAVLSVDYRGLLTGTVPLRTVQDLDSYAWVGRDSAAVSVSRFRLQSRYPEALEKKAASFAVLPDADRPSMMYALQVVTMSGKTWRSKPVVFERPGERVLTRVWSAVKARAVDCRLPRSRVPRLDYDFSDAAGDVIRPRSGERHFFGMRGFLASFATLWNRGFSTEGAVPPESEVWNRDHDTRPVRERDAGGDWVLRFDGVNDFVTFPQETVPQWAAPTVEVEFNAEGTNRIETLFASRYDNRPGLIEIVLDRGEVVIRSLVSDTLTSAKELSFRTGMGIVPGHWHSLRVKHTGTSLDVSLDDKTATREATLPATFMNTAILGGAPRSGTEFFSGRVRRLSIDHAANAAEEPIRVGDELQPLWDAYLVNTAKTDAVLTPHRPEYAGVVFKMDRQWEGSACCYCNILKDEDEKGALYRMYYLARHIGRFPGAETASNRNEYALGFRRICAIESRDGVNWYRPDYGTTFNGRTNTNVILDEYTDRSRSREALEQRAKAKPNPILFDNFFVLKDPRPDCPSAQRYKALSLDYRLNEKGRRQGDGLACWISSNGVDFVYGWHTGMNSQFGIGGDSLNVAFWNPREKVFEIYARGSHRSAPGSDREGCYSTRDVQHVRTVDFRSFTPAHSRPIRFDEWSEDQGLYTNCIEPYFRNPRIYVGFPSRYVERKSGWTDNYERLPDPEGRRYRMATTARWSGHPRYGITVTDCVFMFSRDGELFHRTDEAFMRPGPEHARGWYYGACYPARGMVVTPGRRGDDPELSFYVPCGLWSDGPTLIERYVLRVDGFLSYNAKYDNRNPRRLVTKRLVFDGDEMKINFSTSARGGLYVTIRDDAGKSITTDEIFGDSIDRTVGFKDGSVADFAGRSAVIEFRMSDADLYSFRFVKKHGK